MKTGDRAGSSCPAPAPDRYDPHYLRDERRRPAGIPVTGSPLSSRPRQRKPSERVRGKVSIRSGRAMQAAPLNRHSRPSDRPFGRQRRRRLFLLYGEHPLLSVHAPDCRIPQRLRPPRCQRPPPSRPGPITPRGDRPRSACSAAASSARASPTFAAPSLTSTRPATVRFRPGPGAAPADAESSTARVLSSTVWYSYRLKLPASFWAGGRSKFQAVLRPGSLNILCQCR